MSMRDRDVIEMAQEAGFVFGMTDPMVMVKYIPQYGFERLAELIRAEERARVTNVLLEMHDKATPPHPYYKHAALEINRK